MFLFERISGKFDREFSVSLIVSSSVRKSQVLKFRTDQRADIRKMERLTEWMLLRMTSPQTKEEIQTEFASLLEGEAAN